MSRRHFCDRYSGNLVWPERGWDAPRYDERHIALSTAIIAASIIGAGATVGSELVATNAAKTAANDQLSYEEQALQVQNANTQSQLNFEKQQWAQQQANLQPYLNASKATLGQLMSGIGVSYDPNAPLPTTPTGGTTVPTTVPAGQVVPLGTTIPTSPTPTSASATPPTNLGTMYQAAPTNRGAVPPTGAPPAGPQTPVQPQGAALPPTAQVSPAVAAGGSGYGGQGGAPPPPEQQQQVGTRSRVQWPDGSEQDIDSGDTAQYVQLGAQVVA